MTELTVVLDDESMDTLKALAEANNQSETDTLSSILSEAVKEKAEGIRAN